MQLSLQIKLQTQKYFHEKVFLTFLEVYKFYYISCTILFLFELLKITLRVLFNIFALPELTLAKST